MQEPFPILTYLCILSWGGNIPVLPDGFLGRSAPCLQEISLYGVPFPALPTLLLSTLDLDTLHLLDIPPTGYISPEVMVVCLAALPRLKSFQIEFRFATPRPNQIRTMHPVTRMTLPALTHFRCKGASEYLEDLVARIDSPQLNGIHIIYLNQLVDFEVGQLSKFIDRSLGPKLIPFRHADVTFLDEWVGITYGPLYRPFQQSGPADVQIGIYCNDFDWQVSHMAQVLSHISVRFPFVIHLNLYSTRAYSQSGGVDHVDWQHLLRQFSAVKTLQVSPLLTKHVAPALEDIPEEIVAEVLPSLDLIRLEPQPTSPITNFIAVRQLSGRPVTVVDTRIEFYGRLKSYASE